MVITYRSLIVPCASSRMTTSSISSRHTRTKPSPCSYQLSMSSQILTGIRFFRSHSSLSRQFWRRSTLWPSMKPSTSVKERLPKQKCSSINSLTKSEPHSTTNGLLLTTSFNKTIPHSSSPRYHSPRRISFAISTHSTWKSTTRSRLSSFEQYKLTTFVICMQQSSKDATTCKCRAKMSVLKQTLLKCLCSLLLNKD